MYGYINSALRNFLIRDYGQEAWEAIRRSSGLKEDEFVAFQSYPDQVTYKLVSCAAKILTKDEESILRAFGKYCAMYDVEYGEIMEMFDSNIVAALQNLNNLALKSYLAAPEGEAPGLHCTNVTQRSLTLECHRDDVAAAMMIGFFEGLAEKFRSPIQIKHRPRNTEQPYEAFDISLMD